MPVLDQTTSNSYTGNGVTTVFAYTFKLLDEADVLVEVDGVAKTLTTHYTVSGVGNSGGGNITFLSAPANATEVVIQRDMAYLRETDYQDNGDLLAATLDEDIDRVVMQGQQTRDGVARAAKLPVTVTGVDPTLPVPVANRGLKWNAAADGFENGDSDLDAIEAAVAASAAAAASSESAAAASESSANASALSATASASTATTQAGIATTKAGEASASASAALTSENNAETAETNAAASLADALAIYGSIAAVQSAASDAAASASAAQTAETNAETAETNAAASAAAAAVSDAAANSAYSNSIAIYGSLAAVQSAASSASAYATSASDSATTATNQAASAAASALSAGSVVSQDLSAIDRTVISATIVDTFLYDTSKDSDGGAWRKRCAHTSWENETLSGNWLGSAANETAARLISGATTGSYYYDTTAAAFYTLNAGSGKTATYRGNVRQFPAQVLITVEAARVVLWDITQAGCPMWMVFTTASGYEYIFTSSLVRARVLNGQLVTASGGAVSWVDFIGDKSRGSLIRTSGTGYRVTLPVSGRNNSSATYRILDTLLPALVASGANDVAMTVLPNAPVDVATGLPVPTIAVATDGGVSVITHDGDVWDITATSYGMAGKVMFRDDSKLAFTLDSVITSQRHLHVYAVPTADVSTGTAGYAKGAALEFYSNDPSWSADLIVSPAYDGATVYRLAKGAVGASTGLSLLHENPATPAEGMVAYITTGYNSGWMPGDIKGAWLADTVAETVTGAELITNGTFTTDTTGWTAVGGSGLGVASGELTITNSGAVAGGGSQAITTVVGKTYVASLTARKGTAATVYLNVGTASGGSTLGSVSTTSASNVPLMKSFVATATTTYITGATDATSGGTGIFDNISCRLADVDRSVKAKGLQAFGSLTKAAVASGAQLVGYSGFSAANYFEQPYNPDLDFGTGDFCIMGWVNGSVGGSGKYVFERGAHSGSYSGPGIGLQIDGAGVVTGYVSDDAYATYDSITASAAVFDGTPHLVCLIRRGAAVELWKDAIKAASDVTLTAAIASLSNANAIFRLGLGVAGNAPATIETLALWRASATAPSAEQIKHIYETERPLFEANAQCCLAGSSNAVTALAYCEETGLLHAGTAWGRSALKDLLLVDSEATAVGAITALAAGNGVIVQGGATAVDVYVPAYNLREELLRDAEQMAKFGQNLIAHDFTATASQEVFTLPVGWEIVAVYQQGTLKRETTAWVRTFDGFKWSVDLVTGATVSDWISILAKRV